MKRVLSLTLALPLCLTLFGCTAGTSESSSSLASESSASAVVISAPSCCARIRAYLLSSELLLEIQSATRIG